MLVCMKKWKEPSDNIMHFNVMDTDDWSEEGANEDTIRQALSQGLSIIGIKDEKMYKSSEYRYFNNKDTHIRVDMIDIERWTTRGICLFTLTCRGSSSDKRSVHIYYGSDYVGYFEMNKEHPIYGYVNIDTVGIYRYKGKYLAEAYTSVYDKHHYAEDRGASFVNRCLVYNGKCIAETGFFCDDDGYFEDELPREFNADGALEITKNPFEWCNKTITLK